MKRDYTTPIMICEEFSSNEYVAACGDNNVIYKFKCDAGSRQSYYNVYFDNGTTDTSDDVAWTTSDDDWKNRLATGRTFGKSYHPCGTTHEASATDEFKTGYMYQQTRNGQDSGDPISVIVWTQGGTNTHCTTNLNMKSWETAKS